MNQAVLKEYNAGETAIKAASADFGQNRPKTFTNTTANTAVENVPDIQFWGNGDAFKLLCKASSKREGWMKSTKAYEISSVGCIVQVTTQQFNEVAEALTFVPGVKIEETFDQPNDSPTRKVISRRLIQI